MIHKELWITRLHGIDHPINLGNVVNYAVDKIVTINVIYNNLIDNSDVNRNNN